MEDEKMICPECGELAELEEHKGCSCHINPPCSNCVDRVHVCEKCGWVEDRPSKSYSPSVEKPLIFQERELDNTKIDWKIRPHTHFSMIKYGVYPEGTTADEVRKVVDGTFGGRFVSFGGGKFEFIAYTD